MANDDVWNRLNVQQASIEELRRSDIKHEARMEALEQRTSHLDQSISQLRGENQQQHKSTGDQLARLRSSVEQGTGAVKVAAWLIGTGVVIVGSLLAVVGGLIR